LARRSTSAGVGEAGRSDLDGGGSGEHELDGVCRGSDASHAENGDGDGLGGFVDHAQGDGLDGPVRRGLQ